ncbi:TIGR02646 family protein [Advenella sp. EE-W14]|uniref:TIGR02646 family protein n=1 Tax=Advenella sp. EE-W14 TaxID=2722705 RepID=UPI00145D3C07|nr:TIGR02646 family protein [Advenella sp. EE-W14]
MKKINKKAEPASLIQFKKRSPSAVYDDLPHELRQDIRKACTTEQFHLCAYCCRQLTGNNEDTMNEHVLPQDLAPDRTLDFNNIIASCTTKGQCDSAHKNQHLPLTPLMDECETEFVFKLSGRVEGLTERAKESIKILNLGDTEENNRKLIETRKQLVSTLLYKSGIDPYDPIEDDDILSMVINDLSQPVDNKLQAYAPVVVNILKSWVSTAEPVNKIV